MKKVAEKKNGSISTISILLSVKEVEDHIIRAVIASRNSGPPQFLQIFLRVKYL